MIFRVTVVHKNGKKKVYSAQPGGGKTHDADSMLDFYRKNNVYQDAQSLLVEELEGPGVAMKEIASGARPTGEGRKVVSTASWPAPASEQPEIQPGEQEQPGSNEQEQPGEQVETEAK